MGGSCGIYEGCIVEKNAVVGAGTIITARTPIIDIQSGEEHFGRVPENAVVVPGGARESRQSWIHPANPANHQAQRSAS